MLRIFTFAPLFRLNHFFSMQECAAELSSLSEQHIEKLLEDQSVVHDMQTQALWEATKGVEESLTKAYEHLAKETEVLQIDLHF